MLRNILHNINLINIILTGVLIFLALYLVLPSLKIDSTYTPPVAKKSTANNTDEGAKPSDTETPSLSDYSIIAEQNLFHPDRKIPEGSAKASPAQRPDFILYGTLITDEVSIAYLEDRKAPVKTQGRGKRQVALKKNETLSGFTLKEIEPDRVVMVQGDETITVYLDDPKKLKDREKTTKTTKKASSRRANVMSKPQSKAKKSQKPVRRIRPAPETAIESTKVEQKTKPPAPTTKESSTDEQKETAKQRLLDLFNIRK